MKRSRSNDSKDGGGEDPDDHEKDIIIQNLKLKLLEAEQKINALSSFSLQQHQLDHDLFQSSYADPLIHYELKALNDRHNYMVKRMFDLEKISRKEKDALPPPTQQVQQQLIENNKKLTEDVARLQSEKTKLNYRVEAYQRFIDQLQQEQLQARKKMKELEDENNKLHSQLFLIQQFQATVSHHSVPPPEANHSNLAENQANEDYNPFEMENRSNSPVLVADD